MQIKRHINEIVLYVAFTYLIGLYIIFLRLKAIPNIITDLLYYISVIASLVVLVKNGFKSLLNRIDVKALLLFLVYYILSSMLFFTYGGCSDSSWLFKDWLYSLLPILFYVMFRQTKLKINYQIILRIILYSVLIYDIIALIMLFFPNSSIIGLFHQDMIEQLSVAYALFGILGAILGGFTNVIALIICVLSPISIPRLYKILLSVFLIICVFMVGQRAPVGGVAIVILISLFTQKGKNHLFVILTFALLAVIYANINLEVKGYDVKNAMINRYLDRFDVFTSGDESRGGQWQLSASDSPICFLFGEGVGKYSVVNPCSINPMPDAMLFRIFNEMGLIGLLSYLLFFMVNFFKALQKKDAFMIALVLYIFMANFFNRVLFTAPLSIIPYFLIAFFNWHKINVESSQN